MRLPLVMKTHLKRQNKLYFTFFSMYNIIELYVSGAWWMRNGGNLFNVKLSDWVYLVEGYSIKK